MASQRSQFVVFLAAASMLCAAWISPVRAGTILAEEGWDTIGDLEGWQGNTGATTLTNDSGYLRVSFDELTTPNPAEDSDTIQTGPGSNPALTGDLSMPPNSSIYFMFYAEDFAPRSLSVQFLANSHLWTLDLAPPTQTGVWTPYVATLNFNEGWYDGPGYDESMFLADLYSIEWFAIQINRQYECDNCGTSLAQDYGIDNFSRTYNTPEPEDWAMIGMGLIGLAWSWHKRPRASHA